MTFRFVFGILLMMLLASSNLTSSPPVGTLSGVVKDANGSARRNALVRVQSWEPNRDPKLQYAAEDKFVGYMDSRGMYSVELAIGEYDVFVSFVSLSPTAKKIKIESGKQTVFSPTLPYDRLTKFVD